MEKPEQYIEEVPTLEYVLELVGTDFGFESKFLFILKDEFFTDLGKYLYHIKLKEPRAAAEIVHKFKYKFSVLGMKRAFAFAELHKERLHLGDTNMHEDFKKILKTVDSYLKTV